MDALEKFGKINLIALIYISEGGGAVYTIVISNTML